MKKLALALAITSALFSNAYAEVEGETSTITFKGKIVASTCTLENDFQNGKDIELGTIASNTFAAVNDTSLERDFSISLEDCTVGTYQNAKITFRGDTVNGNTQLNVTGGATNLGLQILESGTPLVLDGSSSTASKALQNGTNTFNFTARYIALDNTVGVGDAFANADFTVEYH